MLARLNLLAVEAASDHAALWIVLQALGSVGAAFLFVLAVVKGVAWLLPQYVTVDQLDRRLLETRIKTSEEIDASRHQLRNEINASGLRIEERIETNTKLIGRIAGKLGIE